MASELREIRIVMTVPDTDALAQRGHAGYTPDGIVDDLRDAIRVTVDAYYDTVPEQFHTRPDVL